MASNEEKVAGLISDAVSKAFTSAIAEQEKKRAEAAAAAAAKDEKPTSEKGFLDLIFGS